MGGRTTLQHRNEINDPWFFRCDQQTKLSSRSETKEVTGGKLREYGALKPLRSHRKCAGSDASVNLGGVSGQKKKKHPEIFMHIHPHYASTSSPPPPSTPSPPVLSHFPPETFRQMLPDSHICAENELYPRALRVKDSLVKNAVLLDEQTNVPCNVVALAFYATLKESINLHNSNEHVPPL